MGKTVTTYLIDGNPKGHKHHQRAEINDDCRGNPLQHYRG